jgi:DNA-directed RNA polymerase specialized sigma24 family protein
MAEEWSWEDDLADFVGPSEARAQTAFGRLIDRSVPIMDRHLRPILPREEDRQDVIQEAQIRVWSYRNRFQNRGIGSWLNFLKITMERCAFDLSRGNAGNLVIEDVPFGEIPDAELPVVATFFELTRDRERLYRLADSLWLGKAVPDLDRRILAGKLFYLDGRPWDQIAARFQVDRRTLDAWLIDPVVLGHVAFEGLYRNNDRLTRHLLGVSPEVDLNVLLMKATRNGEDEPPGGWTWPEVYAIIWKYRFGKLAEHLVAMPDCRLNREELRLLFDRCDGLFPFEEVIRMLMACFDLAPKGEATLKGSPLWRRLVFQYAASDELPHRDILMRTEPAATIAGYSLTLGMLNVWLSNGRLLRALKDHYDRTMGEED